VTRILFDTHVALSVLRQISHLQEPAIAHQSIFGFGSVATLCEGGD
jgi:hypothetical protein